jgi:inner membrane protein
MKQILERMNLKGSPIVKIAFIFIILLIALIPLSMINGLISEREGRNILVKEEIIRGNGGVPSFSGPFLKVPYRYNDVDKDGKRIVRTSRMIYSPDQLSIDGDLNTNILYRGIYEVPVFSGTLSMTGIWNPLETLSFPEGKIIEIFWNQAVFVVETSAPKGIRTEPILVWDGESIPLKTDRGTLGFHDTALIAGLPNVDPIGGKWKDPVEFSIQFEVRGGQSLSFTPAGLKTDIHISSDWPSPSFQGAILPDFRSVEETGFEAEWRILETGRHFPYSWFSGINGGYFELHDSDISIAFLDPVNSYLMSTRSVKYGLLFLLLPFLVFFLFEVFTEINVHPIQYIMVGIANIVFYMLLLSLSEHMNFFFAFWLGAVATSILITYYTAFVLRSKKRAGVLFPILLGAYAFLYFALKSEDYALIIGSIGLFFILAVVMVLTRKVNWYAPR